MMMIAKQRVWPLISNLTLRAGFDIKNYILYTDVCMQINQNELVGMIHMGFNNIISSSLDRGMLYWFLW